MNLQRTVLALGLLLASGLASGQDSKLRYDPQKQMYEDIEILRRLLTGRLDPVPSSVGMPFRLSTNSYPSWHGHLVPYLDGLSNTFYLGERQLGGRMNLNRWYDSAQPKSLPLDCEGIYLKGQGVLYTVTMPPPERDPRPEPPKPAAKPLSEWERVRQQVRGDKPGPEDKAAEQKEPSLADVVLKVLAENGQHFVQLGDNESLTVAITFRQAEKPSPASQVIDAFNQAIQPGTGGGGEGGVPGTRGTPGSPDGGGPIPGRIGSPDGGPGGVGPGIPGGVPGPGEAGGVRPPSSARDYELLGDLHLKQGSVQKAVEAFKKGVELNPEPRQAAALYRKLAQAHLQLTDQDSQKVLEKATEFLKRAQDETDKAAKSPAATASAALPAKLIISAPKKLLDQAGAGKISFEDFKKAATVEYLTFAPPEKKAGKKE